VGVYGADVAQLRGTATELDRAAEKLASISQTLGGALESAPWHGADAASFRSQWTSDYSRRIADSEARLREAARTLRANAADQESTSAASGGALAGGGGDSGAGSAGGGSGSGKGDGGAGGKGDGGSGKGDGGPKIVVGADGEVTPTGLAGRVGASARYDEHWDVAGADIHRQGDYGVGAKGSVGANFTFSGDEDRGFSGKKWGDDNEKPGSANFQAGVQASGKAGAWAEDKLSTEVGVASATVGYEALAGARADAGAGVKFGGDGGLEAGAKLGAFAGAEIKGTVSGEAMGVTGGVTAGARAGIGANASANIDLGADKVKLEFELGASLGVGFSIKPSISFSPSEMASDVKKIFGF
jgi:hypothetical protein